MLMNGSMLMTRAQAQLALAAAVLALPGAAAAQGGATDDPRLLAVTRSVETELVAGRSARALRGARQALDDLMESGPAAADGPTIALLLYYQAVAAADRDLTDTAAWSWSLAQSLDPRLAREDLGRWGRGGAFLAARPVRPPAPDGDVTPESNGRPRRPHNLFEAPADVSTRLPQEADAPPPRYPPVLRGSGVRGAVLFQVRIDSQGRIHDPLLLESPHPLLALAAADTLAEWRYRPAEIDGDAVGVYYQVRIDFRAE